MEESVPLLRMNCYMLLNPIKCLPPTKLNLRGLSICGDLNHKSSY